MEQWEEDQIRQRNWGVSAGLLDRPRKRLLPGSGCGAYRIMGNSRRTKDYASAFVGIRPEAVRDRIDCGGSYSGFRHAQEYRKKVEDDAQEDEEETPIS